MFSLVCFIGLALQKWKKIPFRVRRKVFESSQDLLGKISNLAKE